MLFFFDKWELIIFYHNIDDAMVIDEPAKPVAGSSKHPNDVDVIDGELIY